MTQLRSSVSGPTADPFVSSGQSPGRGVPSLHLVGPGAVGREFLRLLPGLPVRLVAVTDRSATVFAPGGLDGPAVAAHKTAGLPLAAWPGGEPLPTSLAISLCGADVVVDATPTDAACAEGSLERIRVALRGGARVVVAGKAALAVGAAYWLGGPQRARVGIHAALGGTGRRLCLELDELRAHCRAVRLAANATSSVVLHAIEAGLDLDAGLAAARSRGLLEGDPGADLDGRDAACKLLVAWGAVFGAPGRPGPTLADVVRTDLRALAPERLRAHAASGGTTRILACGDRQGNLRVVAEELPPGSPFAAAGDRVVYGYELPSGWRLHTGVGLGPRGTAEALAMDLRDVSAAEVVR